MIQSTLLPLRAGGLHVAIIMDGNGRWAEAHGKPRTAGHREGARTVRRIVERAADQGIGTLTLYAFSSDNWNRPPDEVRSLMRLFTAYLRREAESCAEQGVRIRIIGRRDRLPRPLHEAVLRAEGTTSEGRSLLVRIALDYSARDSILEAAARLAGGRGGSREAFARALGEALHESLPVPDVDLLIRTGGEQRLSDFLLWESAYAELWFTDVMWPDFTPEHLAAALRDFSARERRFGRVTGTAQGEADVRSLAS
jgi:undecaprenyl diphosphate synthase